MATAKGCMRINFNYQSQEIAEASKMMRKVINQHRRWKIWLVWIFVGLMLSMFVAANFLFKIQIQPATPKPPPAAPDWFVLGPALVVISAFCISIFVIRQRQKGRWLDGPIGLPQTLDVNEQGITLSSSVQSWTCQWHALSRMDEGRFILLLRVMESRQFITIPVRAFDLPQLEQFKEMVAQRLHPRLGAFPVITANEK
jgi:YcxB-like protein